MLNVDQLERMITRHPSISREAYSLLINNYKAYDARQKKLLNQAYQDINKLSKLIQSLEKELSFYRESLGETNAESVRAKLENYDSMKQDRNAYKRMALICEQKLLAIEFPQYDFKRISSEDRKAILEILSNYGTTESDNSGD